MVKKTRNKRKTSKRKKMCKVKLRIFTAEIRMSLGTCYVLGTYDRQAKNVREYTSLRAPIVTTTRNITVRANP